MHKAEAEERRLQLEVFVNEERIGLIGSFLLLDDGRMAVRENELQDLGIKAISPKAVDDLVILDALPDIRYRYDEQAQTISFSLDDGRRMPHVYDFAGSAAPTGPAVSGFGSVLDYSLFASDSFDFDRERSYFDGASVTLGERLFSPFGVLSQTAIVGTTTARSFDVLRLDSSFRYSDPESLLTYTIGDAVSGGLPWTRSIRFGGLQIRRNFSLRPDLITIPLPSFSGSAAVPSTVDVYVDTVNVLSQDVGSGPFEITNLPAVWGENARVVLSDSAGREFESLLPLYSTQELLRKGLSDFSLEGGFPRLDYGIESADYSSEPFASASYRLGLFDWLTAQSHAEYAAGLVNGGVGAAVRLGRVGAMSFALSASELSGESGFQLFGEYETQIGQLTLGIGSQRSFGEYLDVAAVTALHPDHSWDSGTKSDWNVRPPKALDRISASVPVPHDESRLTLSFINLEPASGSDSRIITGSLTRPLLDYAQLQVTGFADFAGDHAMGAFAGLSIPIGAWGSASTGVSTGSNGTQVTSDLVKSPTDQIGSYGWRLRDSEGQTTYRSAAVLYRSPVATLEAGVDQSDSSVRFYGQADGSVAVMDGDFFFANPITDSFAIVDAGAPNVDVLYENRPIGKTGHDGRLLLPALRSYASNKISIDPKNLPVNADIAQAEGVVVPADRSGVLVRFDVRNKDDAALVILVDSAGKPLPVGSSIHLAGQGSEFILGYDGRAYLPNLHATNEVLVNTGTRECMARFSFSPQADRQVMVGPLVCE